MMSVHDVFALVGIVIYSYPNLFVSNDCVFELFFYPWFMPVLRIEKTKNRVKSDLEATIKATDSKHEEVVTAIDLADSKKKEMEFDIGLKHQNLKRALAKQKRLRDIWASLDRKENDLLSQEIRTIRVLDELNPFSIDDNGAELFENSAEISISDYPELLDFDFSQFLEGFDFSSIPISAPATFQG